MDNKTQKIRLPILNSPGVSRFVNLLTAPIALPVIFFSTTFLAAYAVSLGRKESDPAENNVPQDKWFSPSVAEGKRFHDTWSSPLPRFQDIPFEGVLAVIWVSFYKTRPCFTFAFRFVYFTYVVLLVCCTSQSMFSLWSCLWPLHFARCEHAQSVHRSNTSNVGHSVI